MANARAEIHIGPLERLAQADAIKELFRDIPGSGRSRICRARFLRRFAVRTASSNDDLLDLFAFHVAKEKVSILAPRRARRLQCACGAGARARCGPALWFLCRRSGRACGSWPPAAAGGWCGPSAQRTAAGGSAGGQRGQPGVQWSRPPSAWP